jgi:hypothetical protein
VLSPPFALPAAASPPADVVTLCHASFLLSQDELAASTSSSGNALSHRLSSRAEIEALNPHHHRRPPFSDRSTPTPQCYKKVHLNLGHSFHHLIMSPFCILLR